MTYTTARPTGQSPFNSPAYRQPRKVETKVANPYAAMEFQLIRHVTHGVIGRLYSPNRKINTQGSKRTIISNTGKVVLFISTTEDYLFLSKNCRASNLSANKIRTNIMLQELQGFRAPDLTLPIEPELPAVPIMAVQETFVGNGELTQDLIPPTLPLLMPAPTEESIIEEIDQLPIAEVEEEIEIDLKATLEDMTATALGKLVNQISVKYDGKRRKAKYVQFLLNHEEETLQLVA